MSDISVIICAHNPRLDYLGRVLAALKRQTMPKEEWELLVIDNASKAALSTDLDLGWHPHSRIIREDNVGLAYARIRGMSEATGALHVFFDDDNIPASDYLAEALKISRKWPQLGVWGGSIVPEFEIEPKPNLRPYLKFLALREIKMARWSNIPCDEAEPWGAGLCVRRCVSQAYVDSFNKSLLKLSGRQGTCLISGEDTEICMVACKLGLGMGVFPALGLTHLIPPNRLNEDYLVKIAEGIGISTHIIGYKWRGKLPPSVFGVVPFLRHVFYLIRARGVDRKMYFARQKASWAAWRQIKMSMKSRS